MRKGRIRQHACLQEYNIKSANKKTRSSAREPRTFSPSSSDGTFSSIDKSRSVLGCSSRATQVTTRAHKEAINRTSGDARKHKSIDEEPIPQMRTITNRMKNRRRNWLRYKMSTMTNRRALQVFKQISKPLI